MGVDFGDGGTSSSQNPSHNYTVPGTYDVELVATNAGGSDTETKTGYVTVAGQRSSTPKEAESPLAMTAPTARHRLAAHPPLMTKVCKHCGWTATPPHLGRNQKGWEKR